MGRKTFRKVITSEEKVKQINPKNKKLIDLFIKDKSRKCSDATIKGYKSDLDIFFCWAVDNADNKYYPEIKRYELSDFFTFCIDELQWNGKRFARMRSVLSGLSDAVIKYFDEEVGNFRNVINTIIEPIPKEPVREKTVLQDEDVKKLLDYLSNELNNPRDACLLALAAYSGSRISELAQYKIDTIDPTRIEYGGLLLETTHKIRTKGFGKQGKQLYKYIVKDLFLPYYTTYLEQRQSIVDKTGSQSDLLFLQNNGNPATVTTFNSWKSKWEKYLNTDIYFHCLRHFYTTALVRQGLSKELIMEIVGWSSDMVGTYTDIEAKDKDWSKDLAKLSGLINNE